MHFQAEANRFKCATDIVGHINDRDVLAALNQREFFLSLRQEIVDRVADRLMDRIGPAIEKAIADVFGEPETE